MSMNSPHIPTMKFYRSSNRTAATDVNMDESQWSEKQVEEEYIHYGSISVKVKTRLLIKNMANDKKGND